MKKYIFIITILAIGVFSSCNDDIPIDELKPIYNVTFQLIPETIVEPFEYTRYNIERADYSKLHLRLLIYNEQDGQLVASSDTLIKSYLVKPNLSLGLQEGNYVAIALSNEKLNDGYEYWTLSGEQQLSSLTLTKDNETKWDSWNNLLGFTSTRLRISKNGIVNSMELKPISAIFWIIYDNVHAWGNGLTQLRFDGDRQEESVRFDNNINPLYSFNISDNISSYFVHDYVNVDEVEDDLEIHAFCIQPATEFKMSFFCTLDGDDYNLGNGIRISNLEAGREYYAYIGLSAEDKHLYYYDDCGFLKDFLSEDDANAPYIEQSSLSQNLFNNRCLKFDNSKNTIKVKNLIK